MRAWFSDLFGAKKDQALMLIFNLDLLTPKKKTAPVLAFKPYSNGPPRCG
jgi:hypothetical protein